MYIEAVNLLTQFSKLSLSWLTPPAQSIVMPDLYIRNILFCYSYFHCVVTVEGSPTNVCLKICSLTANDESESGDSEDYTKTYSSHSRHKHMRHRSHHKHRHMKVFL